jgi:hypothetical protein
MVYVPYDGEDFDEQSSEPIHNYPTDKAEYKLEVFPTAITFANTKVGDASSPIPLVLMNKGYSALTIQNVRVVGDFELVDNYPLELQPDQALSIQIRFVPKVKGTITGGVFIDTGDAAGREFIDLAGFATSAYQANLGTDIIRATNTHTGTANAIQATTEEVVPLASGAKLIALDIFVNNTTAATVQFNDMAPLTILEVDGTGLESGDLVASTMVLGYITGSNFRLLTDNTVAAALSLIYEHRDAAEDAAEQAEAALLEMTGIIAGFISHSSTVDLPSIPANTRIEITVATLGAILGDVFVGASMSINTAGLVFNGYVSAADTTKVTVTNTTDAAIDLVSATLKVILQR